jgi:hypothetical protein
MFKPFKKEENKYEGHRGLVIGKSLLRVSETNKLFREYDCIGHRVDESEYENVILKFMIERNKSISLN